MMYLKWKSKHIISSFAFLCRTRLSPYSKTKVWDIVGRWRTRDTEPREVQSVGFLSKPFRNPEESSDFQVISN